MKLKKNIVTLLAATMIPTLSACGFTTEYTYKDLKFSISSDYELKNTDNAYLFENDIVSITVMPKESTLRKLVNDSDYISEHDVEYKTDSLEINDIYFARTYMEYSKVKDDDKRYVSIEYSFNVSGKNYIIFVSDIRNTEDIEAVKDELYNMIDNMDISWK